jgi:outer membrane protein
VKKNFLVLLSLTISLAVGVYSFMHDHRENRAYIYNQKVFDAFKGKKELEKKLSNLKTQHKGELDSLSQLISARNNDPKLIEYYQQRARDFEMNQQQLSATYTADIWKRINQYTLTFGKEKGYDFIIGATGDGNLMYANEAYDVTEDLIKFINLKYEQGS